MDAYGWIDRSLATIHRAGWHRRTQVVNGPGPEIVVAGQTLLNFSSNDYLGLAGDDRLKQAAKDAIDRYGTGATGSRLVTGEREIHRELEASIARLKHTEDALVFSSGYGANLGAIAAFVGARDLVLGDRYNHSSLRLGAVASGATVVDYEHGNLGDLAEKLEEMRSRFQRCLIITDTVFSMDGDLCPLPGILNLAEKYEAMVLVDEAHGTGVLGHTGAGAVEHFGATGRPLVQMGTLSKSLGSMGGFIAGSASVIDFLRNRAPSWIYTTGLSPADVGAAIAAIEVLRTEPDRRLKLWENIKRLKMGLVKIPGLLPSDSAIVCLTLPSVERAVGASQILRSAGIFAPAIRPPTVPTSRIRMTVMATHGVEQIDRLVEVVGNLGLDI
jgi:8-amino-7-oxononanoate synthase